MLHLTKKQIGLVTGHVGRKTGINVPKELIAIVMSFCFVPYIPKSLSFLLKNKNNRFYSCAMSLMDKYYQTQGNNKDFIGEWEVKY